MTTSEQSADRDREAMEQGISAGGKSPSLTAKEAQSSEILAVLAEMPSRIPSKACLGVIAVEIRNPDNNRKTKVYALQDTGANATILRKSVAAKLGLNGERTQQTFFRI